MCPVAGWVVYLRQYPASSASITLEANSGIVGEAEAVIVGFEFDGLGAATDVLDA